MFRHCLSFARNGTVKFVKDAADQNLVDRSSTQVQDHGSVVEYFPTTVTHSTFTGGTEEALTQSVSRAVKETRVDEPPSIDLKGSTLEEQKDELLGVRLRPVAGRPKSYPKKVRHHPSKVKKTGPNEFRMNAIRNGVEAAVGRPQIVAANADDGGPDEILAYRAAHVGVTVADGISANGMLDSGANGSG